MERRIGIRVSERPPAQRRPMWTLKCHDCGDRISIELPAGMGEGATGTATCHRGHTLLYGFDGMTVMLLDASLLERR